MGHVVRSEVCFEYKLNTIDCSSLSPWQLGIGPLWKVNGLIDQNQVPCPYKLDSAASREFQALSGCTGAIPVEMSFTRAGSNCAHWQEYCLKSEMMTPTANADLPISRMTIASLEDLGYTVDYGAADNYFPGRLNPACRCNLDRVRRRLSDNQTNSIEDNRHAQQQRRRLSEEGYQAALAYGKKEIAENQQSMALFPGDDQLSDLGTEMIYVLYLENDVVHHIMVMPDF